ncbi:sensor histidine kinase [Clostridium sp. SM-530-WT-3G]|uniref:sensor histidine kinase n=1 Tax=Clostridium sp. SM-530-WT-3G TaxID=2725303 RepID=UPI00145D8304|nr:sensor histidine kinase [Clostridium sp. SM-530-WT-3G]NME83563.1 HAMP domain-containing histidine kinase [Clostridium sp. SM-530-WT-3G]
MNIRDYLKSNSPFLILNFMVYMLIFVIMKIADMPNIILFSIFFIWFAPVVIYMILNYRKELKFYGEIINIIEKLDKKYLVAELIKRPNYYEGKIFYDCLRECNRNMHEEVNVHKFLQREYREYIETWVHEIKTPISSLKLTLENSRLNEKNELIREIEKIEKYITQALYYSRSTDVSKDYIVKEFNLEDVVNECIRENRRDFINKRISLKIDRVNINVICDSKWLKFILNQIIINSIKYCRESGAQTKIYTEENDKSSEYYVKDRKLNLIIEDNGIGISERDINRVFDKGFTGENGRVYGKSTGIGLYLCKKLCCKLQLDINIKSKKEYGTKVIISF